MSGGRPLARSDRRSTTEPTHDSPRWPGRAVLIGCALGALAIFGWMLSVALDPHQVATLDLPLLRHVTSARTSVLVTAARVVSTAGSPTVLCVLAVGVTLWLARIARSYRPVVLTTVVLCGGGVLDAGFKNIVARPRPPIELRAVAAHGYSFPSGHSLFAALVLPLIAVLVAPKLQSVGRRAMSWLAAILAVVVIGLSRLVLGVHYLSDVLAGWSLAAAWLFLALALVRNQSLTRGGGADS